MSSINSATANLTKTALVIACAIAFSQEASALPDGWTYTGNAGVGSPNGSITAPPASDITDFYYVSTSGGVAGAGQLPSVGGTNGSVLTSSLFYADAGSILDFYYNYATKDGGSYGDYAWARLLDSSQNQVALLITARTSPGGNSIPGYGLPAPSAGVELVPPTGMSTNPPDVNKSFWDKLDKLGEFAGCYTKAGCGYTGWVESLYTISNAGNYYLQFGVTNWGDTAFQSGLAISDARVSGVSIQDQPGQAPEPTAVALFGIGLASMFASRRKT